MGIFGCLANTTPEALTYLQIRQGTEKTKNPPKICTERIITLSGNLVMDQFALHNYSGRNNFTKEKYIQV